MTSSDGPGTSPRGARSNGPTRWLTHDHPSFWFVAAAVFAGNALVATWQGDWTLSVLQATTAVLALRAAFLVALGRVSR